MVPCGEFLFGDSVTFLCVAGFESGGLSYKHVIMYLQKFEIYIDDLGHFEYGLYPILSS